MDYRETLNLPKTAFPMKANLPEREPEWVATWQREGLYRQIRQVRRSAPKFVLHDGPPYANGDIHTGTALNKILKDMINRFHALEGYDAVYVPGWDTHGLPIEMRALKTLGVDQHQIDPLSLRRECARVARHYIEVMTREFQRLGVEGDWEHPYVTMNPVYEGAELAVFADMTEKGLIYRDLKSVYWCPHCETALAEGEIEYRSHQSDSIYVAFDLKTPGQRGLPEGTRPVIWTTTPWTMPANVAIAVHPDLWYTVVDTAVGPLLLGTGLWVAALKTMNLTAVQVLGQWKGSDLEGVMAVHPYLGHDVPIVLGEHVTQESGTGLVHTAPGHGVEDFEVGRRYGLAVVQPLNDQGRYVKGTPLVEGLFYADANPVVMATLKDGGALLAAAKYDHQYAFCWRCKNPIIYRATSQWFMSIDPVREQLLAATYPVRWDPEWGGERMRRMVEDRDDWCLSRQRAWGVPIPAFHCQTCGKAILDAELVRHVASVIGREGSDSWWEHEAAHFLPQGYRCPDCGGDQLTQERDIFDVWLDSGSSQAAVLADHPDLSWPADLILEGNDQYRGWFNSLLTTGVATRGQAPYRRVLTHGMVLDQLGREMHKSLGNTVDPMDIANQYGADILRIWVATSDYRTDVRISDDILRQLAETYRKIRNTFRFLLGNLGDFDPDRMDVGGEPQDWLNRWAVATVNRWLEEAQAACRAYLFHGMVHGLVRLVTSDLSSFYLDVIKDRLYTLAPDAALRRETQRVLYFMLEALNRVISPVLVFTSEEVYQHSPKRGGSPPSVHMTAWPAPWPVTWTAADGARMERLRGYRDAALKALEALRAQKIIGNSLEGMVELTLAPGEPPLTEDDVALLTELTLSAGAAVVAGEAGEVRAYKTAYARCARCWRHTPDVGRVPEHPDVCERCAGVLAELAR